jgi:hypothetical protein
MMKLRSKVASNSMHNDDDDDDGNEYDYYDDDAYGDVDDNYCLMVYISCSMTMIGPTMKGTREREQLVIHADALNEDDDDDEDDNNYDDDYYDDELTCGVSEPMMMMGLSRKGASTTSQVRQKAAMKSFTGSPAARGIV